MSRTRCSSSTPSSVGRSRSAGARDAEHLTSSRAVPPSGLTFVTTGTCTIAANQAGNANYNAAPQVQQSFTISTPAGLGIVITGGSGTPKASCGSVSVNYTCNITGVGSGFADLDVPGIVFDRNLQPTTLTALALGIIANANRDPRLNRVFSTYTASNPSIYLDIDREKAQALGLARHRRVVDRLHVDAELVEQGVEMGRPSLLRLEASGSGAANRPARRTMPNPSSTATPRLCAPRSTSASARPEVDHDSPSARKAGSRLSSTSRARKAWAKAWGISAGWPAPWAAARPSTTRSM